MPGPLHIAISARALSLPFGGVKEHLDSMIRELLKLNSPHRFTIYYAEQNLIGTNSQANEVYFSAPHKFFWDHWILPGHLARDKPDVVWFPHNVSSLGITMPTVVSVHDLLYFALPGCAWREYTLASTLYMRVFMAHSLKKAKHIVAVSDCTARDIVRVLNIAPDKISTIHHGPGLEFMPAGEPEQQRVRSRYRLPRPFLFYPGILSPRKNVRLLVKAFAQVQNKIPHDLVITGGGGYKEDPIKDLIARYKLGERFHRLGLVPKEDLVALYGAADAMIFPSLYEGFGIPLLEAFACGCPVVCSTADVLREVAGSAALTFDPRDPAALAAQLLAVAENAALRAELVKAGFGRVQHFSYSRAAKHLLDVLQEAAL